MFGKVAFSIAVAGAIVCPNVGNAATFSKTIVLQGFGTQTFDFFDPIYGTLTSRSLIQTITFPYTINVTNNTGTDQAGFSIAGFNYTASLYDNSMNLVSGLGSSVQVRQDTNYAPGLNVLTGTGSSAISVNGSAFSNNLKTLTVGFQRTGSQPSLTFVNYDPIDGTTTATFGQPTLTLQFSFNYTPSSTPFPASVPEITTWGMMIVGFGFAGWSLRRRNATPRVRFA